MEYIKLQIGCLIVVSYIAFLYYRNKIVVKNQRKFKLFDLALIVNFISIIFDGVTAITVNNLDVVNPTLNKLLHMVFLLSLDSSIFIMFIYMLYTTDLYPKRNKTKLLVYVPFILSSFIVITFIYELKFKYGIISNYSMGISAYTCFFMVAAYTLFTLIIFFKRWRYIEAGKRMSIATYLFALLGVTIIQAFISDLLITCLATTLIVIGVYLNQEDPALTKLKMYHNEMVFGFSTLIENKDFNTGGHIKRTSLYVKLLALGLRKKGYYHNILTSDYINNLSLAAPMHDIGKIGVPDFILQKPGKLTNEEFDVIKLHTTKGGEIILNTFGNLDNNDYLDICYNIALHHHEKWNGNGYPSNLKEEEIPLCARIMAIADVFDAVSEKRCYKDALPLDECFRIIENGKGIDFEPLLVDVFISLRSEIEGIYHSLKRDNNL